MLREIEGVADEPRLRRRWFHDDYFDLFVWQTEKGEVALFQLCYGRESDERALVWHREAGLFHDGRDPAEEGRGTRGRSATGERPVVQPITDRFEAAAGGLPKAIRRAVSGRIRDYVEGKVKPASRRKRVRRAAWQKLPAAQQQPSSER
jgi:hypothetical protein